MRGLWESRMVVVCVSVLSCVPLHGSMDCSPPGSSVHRISQARTLEWVAISFSRGASHPGIELTSPALADRFFTTEPPGKVRENSSQVHLLFFSYIQPGKCGHGAGTKMNHFSVMWVPSCRHKRENLRSVKTC